MSKSGKWAVLALNLIIIISAMTAMLTEKEIYPFAPYTMYSSVHRPDWHQYELRFEKKNGSNRRVQDGDLRPNDYTKVLTSIVNTYFRNDLDNNIKQDLLYEKLKSTYQLYQNVLESGHLEEENIYKIQFMTSRFESLEKLRNSKPPIRSTITEYIYDPKDF